jgi:hypothetical protein
LKFELDFWILRFRHEGYMLSFDLYRLIKELLIKGVILIVVLAIGHRETIIPSTVM